MVAIRIQRFVLQVTCDDVPAPLEDSHPRRLAHPGPPSQSQAGAQIPLSSGIGHDRLGSWVNTPKPRHKSPRAIVDGPGTARHRWATWLPFGLVTYTALAVQHRQLVHGRR